MGCCHSKKEDDRGAAGNTYAAQFDEADIAAQLISTGGNNALSSRVELSISCVNLNKMDRSSQSDPFCVIYTKASPEGQWVEFGRTEIIANTQNPHFVTLIPMMYHFEEVQYLRFDVFDADTSFTSTDAKTLRFEDQDFQGTAECVLAQIMGGRSNTWTGPLANSQIASTGEISIRGEEVSNSNASVDLQLCGEEIGGERIAKPSSFLRLSRVPETGMPVPFYKTEVRSTTASPAWNELKTNSQMLCNGDPYRPILIECYDHKKSGDHVLLGKTTRSLNDLASFATSKQPMDLEPSGKLYIGKCDIVPQSSFLSYIAGGTEIAFSVAIDYTASNGDPRTPDSLHYVDPTGQRLTPYAQAMVGVGRVLEYYDSDKLFPVYGFGGILQPGSPANHCFAASGNEVDPQVQGVQGILDVYYQNLKTIQLSGPTIFQNIISNAAAFAASAVSADPSQQKYHILMIMTDGVINDMENTIDAIVQASALPMSIVIVGVGNADFSLMKVLDGDDVKLRNSSGVECTRDMVQFVPMNEFAEQTPEAVAKEVLAEIPRQFLDYMKANGIAPLPPRI